MTQRRFGWLALLSVVLGACNGPEDGLDAHFTVGLPLEVEDVDYARVRVAQRGEVQEAPIEAGQTAEFTVQSGLPVDIEATLFALAPGAWRAFTAAQSTTPAAGENTLGLSLQQTESISTRINAAYARTGELVPVAKPLPVDLVDRETGFAAPEVTQTGAEVTVPVGRHFDVRVVGPFGDVHAQAWRPSARARGLTVTLGAAPPLPVADSVFTQSPDVELAAAVKGVPGLTLECAVGDSCGAADDWAPCSQTLSLPEPINQTIQVRYAEVPALGCTSVPVRYDSTAPSVTVTLDPPYFAGNTPVQALLEASEPLDATQLEVYDPQTGARPCADVLVLDANATRVQCTLPDDAAGKANLELRGADPAGNDFAVSLSVPSPQPDGVQVGQISVYPSPLRPQDWQALVAVDLLNTKDSRACAEIPLFSVELGDANEPAFTAEKVLPGEVIIPGAGPDDHPGRRRVWIRLRRADGSGGALETLSLSGEYGNFDPQQGCQYDDPPASFTAGVAVQSSNAPPGWYTDGPLVLSPWFFPDFAQFAPVPVPLPFAWQGASSDASVVDVVQNDFLALETVAPGAATLEWTYNPTDDVLAQPAEVAKPATVWVLGDNALVGVDRFAERAEFALPEELGQPLRILWESQRGQPVVLGESGLWMPAGASPQPVSEPCGAERVVDGAITGTAPAHSSETPRVALLVEGEDGAMSHCEVALDTGTPALAAPLPDDTCGARTATHLRADPASGVFTVFGDGCAASYQTRSGELTELHQADSGPRGPILDVAADPVGGTAAVLTLENGDAPTVDLWRLGAALGRAGTLPRFGVDAVTAVTFQSTTGFPIVGGFRSAEPNGRSLEPLYYPSRTVREPLPEVGLPPITVGPEVEWRTLAFETGASILWAVDTDTPPRLYALKMPRGQQGFSPSVELIAERTLPLASVVDMAIGGPQIIGVHPKTVTPGGVVTVVGKNFAGDGSDKVYIHGVRAPVLQSSTHRLLARVPAGFAKQRSGSDAGANANVWVVTHGRASAPAAQSLRVGRPWAAVSVSEDFGAGEVACWNGECSSEVRLLDSGSTIFGLHEEISAGLELGPSLFAPTSLDGFAQQPGTQRLLGTSGDALVDLLLTSSVSQGESRQVDASFSSASEVAAAAGRNAAAVAGRDQSNEAPTIFFYWASSFSEAARINVQEDFPGSLPSDLAFFPAGDVLVAGAANGALAAYGPPDAPKRLPLQEDTGNCPTGGPETPPKLATLAPVFGEPAEVVGLLHTQDDIAVLRVRRDGDGGLLASCTTRASVPGSLFSSVEAFIAPSGRTAVLKTDWNLLFYDLNDLAGLFYRVDLVETDLRGSGDVLLSRDERNVYVTSDASLGAWRVAWE